MSTMRSLWGGALAVTLLTLGCSSDDSNDQETRDHSAASQEADPGGDEAAANRAGSELAVDTVALAQARDIIRTGVMEVVVDDVDDAADEARDRVTAADGFVADESAVDEEAEVDLTVRVPNARFEEVRGQLAELGDVARQQFEAEDVTAQVVDVESRIASMRASVERLQTLLGGAGDVGQLALVEGELARREADLEALLGQQRVLRDQVDLATITLRLSEEERPSPDDSVPSFGDGLRQGWVFALDGGRAALAAIGFLVPFALPAALVALAWRWLWQRRRVVPAMQPPESGP